MATEGQAGVVTLHQARALVRSAGTTNESAFLNQVKKAARLLGWRVYHTFDSRRSDPGFPDLVLVRPPRIIFWELKSQKGKVRPEQTAWLTALAGCGDVEAGVIRPSDIDYVIDELTRRQD